MSTLSVQSHTRSKTRILAEGSLMVAASLVLSYFKIQFFLAGSINFAMIPIILFAVRWGLGWGMAAGGIFGTLKFVLAGGYAWNWASILLDYTIAYAAVGTAGLCKGRKWGLPAGALVGCFARFIIHFLTGITIYKINMPTEVLGVLVASPYFYSVLYNIAYMLPNTIIAVVVCVLLQKPLERYLPMPKAAR